jgi:hypothetical protein
LEDLLVTDWEVPLNWDIEHSSRGGFFGGIMLWLLRVLSIRGVLCETDSDAFF